MNAKIKIASIALVLSLLVLSACTANPSPSGSATGTPKAEIANPATASCELKGYRSQIRTTADGSQYGVCIFSDGSECEEWAYLRDECAPASEKPTMGTDSSQIANPASAYCEEKGGKVDIRTAEDGSQGGVCVFPVSRSICPARGKTVEENTVGQHATARAESLARGWCLPPLRPPV